MFRVVPLAQRAIVAGCAAAALSGCGTSRTVQSDAQPPVTTASPPAVGGPSHVVGMAPVAKGGLPAVVILQSKTDGPPPAQTAAPVMDQISLTFTPTVMFALTGQPAEFRNSDETLHNIRVRNDETKEGAFNVARPTGGSYTHTFLRDGFYDVGCDIHPAMAAVVIATATPYTTVAAADGSFMVPDVPPGAYKLTIYADVQKIERSVEIVAGQTDLGVVRN